MKKVLIKLGSIVAIIVMFILLAAYIKKLHNKLEINEQNRIATVKLYNNEKNKTYALRMQIEDIDRINNNQIRELDSIRKALKIKDKHIKALYNKKSYAEIHDTIILNTIYKDSIDDIYDYEWPCIDTCVGDKQWYDICINITSDASDSNKSIIHDMMLVSTHFKSDLSIITTEKREIIGVPRKTWIGRLFQRKTKSISILAIEQNPYVHNDSTIFIVPIK